MRSGRLAAGLAAAILVALVPVSGVRAVEVDWGTPTASATYGQEIRFEQPATLPAGIHRVELLLESPDDIGPLVVELPEVPRGRTTLEHALVVADGHVFPNTVLSARWRVTGDDGTVDTGPAASVSYEDTRFDWRTREGEVVRVHWYEGSDALGERALTIGETAVNEVAELLGVREDEPVDFFVYADEAAFYEAIGPSIQENVGGLALPQIRTLFALIPPGEIDDPWVADVVQHELTHLVFDTATENPYHQPPRWLNEGLATYLSVGLTDRDRAMVEGAGADGSLIPLEGLSDQFPRVRERFFLAYAESTSAVDYLVARHGRDALVQLVRSYATGVSDDEAFEQAIGMPLDAFDAAWRAEVRAQDPIEHGPRPAPAGPLPPGWTTAEGSPGPTLPPAPGGEGGPTAPRPGGDSNGSGLAGLALPLVVGAALLAAAVVVVLLVGQRRRAERQAAARWTAWRDERLGPPPSPPSPPSSGDAPRP